MIVCILAFKGLRENKTREEYIESLRSIRLLMLQGGADAEAMCNLTKSVWYNTIYEEWDSATNKFTMSGGEFHEDFNTSLRLLYADSDVKTIVDELEKQRDTVAALMSDLQNPPEGLEACYNTVESMYDAYLGLTTLAISPTGSLITYSEDFRTYDSDLIKYYEKLNIQIPAE